MIDLRKDRRKFYLIAKDTLELETREDYERRIYNEICAIMANSLIGRTYLSTINPKYVALTKDDYKIFRKLDEVSKRLYLEYK